MTGFNSVYSMVKNAYIDGRHHVSNYRKLANIITTAGIWCDLSMFGGHPVTNFYASTPLYAAQLTGREGVQHGDAVTPYYKYFKEACLFSATAQLNFQSLDYLLYYPFLDGDSTDEQFFDNTITLPRYTTGLGVKAFLVAQGIYTGGQSFTMTYIDDSGNTRITPYASINTAGNTATIANAGTSANNFGWSIPLCQGSYGVRSVTSFTFTGAVGGIFALVLAYPLTAITIQESNISSKTDYFLNDAYRLARVYDGAYINYICLPNSSLSAVAINGYQEFIWG